MSPRCVTTTLIFLQLAVPFTVVWWGGGLWLWRRHRSAGPLVTGERRVVGMVLAWVVVTLVELTVLVCVAAANPTRCTTYEEKTLSRLQTRCADGTRAVSTWSPTLQRWDTTVTPPPGQRCTGQLNPRTRQWEGRCR
jgi:hypothetical protein